MTSIGATEGTGLYSELAAPGDNRSGPIGSNGSTNGVVLAPSVITPRLIGGGVVLSLSESLELAGNPVVMATGNSVIVSRLR